MTSQLVIFRLFSFFFHPLDTKSEFFSRKSTNKIILALLYSRQWLPLSLVPLLVYVMLVVAAGYQYHLHSSYLCPPPYLLADICSRHLTLPQVWLLASSQPVKNRFISVLILTPYL